MCSNVWSTKLILIKHRVVVMTADDASDVDVAANSKTWTFHTHLQPDSTDLNNTQNQCERFNIWTNVKYGYGVE